ncbi:acVLRF1 family peptidyl-tRNA hydrolase [Mariniluteicoccus flavus]
MDRSVRIPRERLIPWTDGFAARHGDPVTTATADVVTLVAPDGAEAHIEVPFGPMVVDDVTAPLAGLADHVARNRSVAVLLVRRGGHAVGLFSGSTLVASKVGYGYVQGRTKAGGWSQQRYARRRANQARSAYADAADDAAATLLPRLEEVDHLVLGGDRPSCAAVLADGRLCGLVGLAENAPFWPTPDPRLRVLKAFPEQFLGLTIGLNALA